MPDTSFHKSTQPFAAEYADEIVYVMRLEMLCAIKTTKYFLGFGKFRCEQINRIKHRCYSHQEIRHHSHCIEMLLVVPGKAHLLNILFVTIFILPLRLARSACSLSYEHGLAYKISLRLLFIPKRHDHEAGGWIGRDG